MKVMLKPFITITYLFIHSARRGRPNVGYGVRASDQVDRRQTVCREAIYDVRSFKSTEQLFSAHIQ